jgi:hypothetical protein
VGVEGAESTGVRATEIFHALGFQADVAQEDDATAANGIGFAIRPVNDVSPEGVGLTLEEGQALVESVDCRVIADQVHACTMCCRHRPHRRRARHFRDARVNYVQTIAGFCRFRGRHLAACSCQMQRRSGGRARSMSTCWRPGRIGIGRARDADLWLRSARSLGERRGYGHDAGSTVLRLLQPVDLVRIGRRDLHVSFVQQSLRLHHQDAGEDAPVRRCWKQADIYEHGDHVPHQ